MAGHGRQRGPQPVYALYTCVSMHTAVRIPVGAGLFTEKWTPFNYKYPGYMRNAIAGGVWGYAPTGKFGNVLL